MTATLYPLLDSLMPLCFGVNWTAQNVCECGWFISETNIQYRQCISGESWSFFDNCHAFVIHNLLTAVGFSLTYNGVEERGQHTYGLYKLEK